MLANSQKSNVITIIFAILVGFSFTASSATSATIIPEFIQYYSISLGQAHYIFFALAIGNLVGFFSGYLSERYGLKRSLYTAFVIQIIAQAVMVSKPQFSIFVLCFFVTGVTISFAVINSFSVMAKTIKQESLLMAYSLVAFCVALITPGWYYVGVIFHSMDSIFSIYLIPLIMIALSGLALTKITLANEINSAANFANNCHNMVSFIKHFRTDTALLYILIFALPMGAFRVTISLLWRYHHTLAYHHIGLALLGYVFVSQIICRYIVLMLVFYLTKYNVNPYLFLHPLAAATIIGALLLIFVVTEHSNVLLWCGAFFLMLGYFLAMQVFKATIASDSNKPSNFGFLYFLQMIAMLIGMGIYYLLHRIHIGYVTPILFIICALGYLWLVAKLKQNNQAST